MIRNSETHLMQFVYRRDRTRLLLSTLLKDPLKHLDRNDFTSTAQNSRRISGSKPATRKILCHITRPGVSSRMTLLWELWSRSRNLTFECWWRCRHAFGSGQRRLMSFLEATPQLIKIPFLRQLYWETTIGYTWGFSGGKKQQSAVDGASSPWRHGLPKGRVNWVPPDSEVI